MSQKLEIIGNYLVITNTVDLTTIEYPTNNVRYKDDSTNILFSYINDDSQSVSFSFSELLDSDGVLFPWQLKYRAFLFGGQNSFPFTIPFKIPPKTDIEVRVNTPSNAGTTSAGSTFELWYEDESI